MEEQLCTVFAFTPTTKDTPYTLRTCGKWETKSSPYEADCITSLRNQYHKPEALFFSLAKHGGILVTDLPGRCMSLRQYQLALEKAYENNAEGLSCRLTEMRVQETNGCIWVYVGDKAQPILFHSSYIVNIHTKMKLAEVGSLAKQGIVEMV